MATFVEVNSVEKKCKVIINLDQIIEIAPLAAGGCHLFINDPASTGGKNAMKVSDSYELFKQFALQTVSSEDIANRIDKITRGRGRPPKSDTATAEQTTYASPDGTISGTVAKDGHPGATW